MSRRGPSISLDSLESNPLFDVAFAEVVEAIPPMPDTTPIRYDDTRSLMVLAWMRGVAWERERRAREETSA
jgi:hypothetical protein